jgi:hypothetical protein
VSAVKANAEFSIRCSLEIESNVTDVSELHEEKQDSQITSSDPGRRIDCNPLSRNAPDSRRDNCEFASNVTDASELQSEKHNLQNTLTDDGNQHLQTR